MFQLQYPSSWMHWLYFSILSAEFHIQFIFLVFPSNNSKKRWQGKTFPAQVSLASVRFAEVQSQAQGDNPYMPNHLMQHKCWVFATTNESAGPEGGKELLHNNKLGTDKRGKRKKLLNVSTFYCSATITISKAFS